MRLDLEQSNTFFDILTPPLLSEDVAVNDTSASKHILCLHKRKDFLTIINLLSLRTSEVAKREAD